MGQSDQPKKVIEFNWLSVAIIVLLLGGSIFLGVRTSKLSKKDQQNIETQAKLEVQRDSAKAQADFWKKEADKLQVKVEDANKNTKDAEQKVYVYRQRYNALKNKPEIHDTVKVVECDKLVERYDNYVEILKRNVASYAHLADTLQLQNKYLDEAYVLCVTLSTQQKEELQKTRTKLRRSKILNWLTSGLFVGSVAVLIAQ